MSFFKDTKKALLEAIEIEKGNIPLKERENMPTPTFYVADSEEKLIDDKEKIMIKNTFIEHSIVINNFIGIVGNQIKTSFTRAYSNNVTYTWPENGNQPIIPDVSINCDIKNRRSTTFLGVPKFIMEVLSDSTEKNDRGAKWGCTRLLK